MGEGPSVAMLAMWVRKSSTLASSKAGSKVGVISPSRGSCVPGTVFHVPSLCSNMDAWHVALRVLTVGVQHWQTRAYASPEGFDQGCEARAVNKRLTKGRGAADRSEQLTMFFVLQDDLKSVDVISPPSRGGPNPPIIPPTCRNNPARTPPCRIYFDPGPAWTTLTSRLRIPR